MSKPEVTITLGSTGQVVKRGGSGSGSKRSVEGRFEILSNKRRRREGNKGNSGVNRVNGTRIGRNDLRLKLMHKSVSKQVRNVVEERKKRDPREKLSKATQRPVPLHRPEPNGILLKEIADDLHQVPFTRIADDSRTRWFPSSGGVDTSRQTGPIPIPMKASPEGAWSVAPTIGIMQQSPQMVEEPLTVPSLLHSLGLGKYSITFQAEEVDMTVLKQMGDKDLKELGIPMGPRKKILLAVMPRPKKQLQ